MSGPLLVIVGGRSGRGTISDCWIGDLTTKQWKKVYSSVCILDTWFDVVYRLSFRNRTKGGGTIVFYHNGGRESG